MFRYLIPSVLLIFVSAVSAQTITSDQVNTGAEKLYRERLAEIRSHVQLDNDPAFLARVERIAATLIGQAKHDYPVASGYEWEIHITDEAGESASCMAGGKILVSEAYVQRLELTDAQLAMLISHEIQHAVLEHNLKEFQEALRLEPDRKQRPFSDLEYAIDHDDKLIAKLTAFDREQESEADQEGLRLAWRAGWPALALAGYFKKLAQTDWMAAANHSDHPSSAGRWRAARQLAEQLNQQSQPTVSP